MDLRSRDRLPIHIAICGSLFFISFPPVSDKARPLIENRYELFPVPVSGLVRMSNSIGVSANRSPRIGICRNNGEVKTTPAAIPEGYF